MLHVFLYSIAYVKTLLQWLKYWGFVSNHENAKNSTSQTNEMHNDEGA